MNQSLSHSRAAALVAIALTATISAPRPVRGQEVPAPQNKATIELKLQGPILTKIPYFGELFRAAGPCHEDCQAAKVVAKPVELNHADFDFEVCQDGQCPLAIKLVDFAKCEAGKCGKCEGGACVAGKCAAGKCEAQACAEACECPVAKTACGSCQVAVKAACACGDKCECGKCAYGAGCQCGHDVVLRHHGLPGLPLPVITHHFAPPPFVAHAPPPHPGGCPAMFEHLLELTAKSAALEAKLEARNEQAELVGEMLELAAENAKLKAQIELAEAKADVTQQLLATALENEQLKAKLAELTSKLESANARTAQPQVDFPKR